MTEEIKIEDDSLPIPPVGAGDAPAHVMTDLETMGTDPYAPIISIGACRFLIDSPNIMHPDDTFYQAITLESCMALGMRPSAGTITWWCGQSKEAQAVLTDPNAVGLPLALDRFTDWFNSRPDDIWGNSARFDLGLLEAAYKACGKEVPWKFYRERCYRTTKSLPGAKQVVLERFGVHHNALDDAVSQAIHLRAIWKHLGL